MSEYEELTKKIEQLRREAERVRKAELKAVIKEIREKIRRFGITREELEPAFAEPGKRKAKASGSTTARKKGRKSRKSSGGKIPPKYRHPVTGETWTGRGHPPKWLMAEEAAGRSRDEFLIDKAD